MLPEDRLKGIADQLRGKDKTAAPVTVREFLSWFDAQRRGSNVVARIREALGKAKLQTEPDFESAYIDSVINFKVVAKPSATGEDAEATQSMTESRSASDSSPSGSPLPAISADPTYRISKLAAANSQPVSVVPDASIQEVATIMLANDFSQVPVMVNPRDVKGIVSWTSIGTRMALGKKSEMVRDLMDAHQELRAEDSLFSAIPIISQHHYVLIRGRDNSITGIVTASDLNEQFLQLSEPFLLLGEIENHIRGILGKKIPPDELAKARDPGDNEREIKGAADLTFGEYIRLLETPATWERLDLRVDRVTFCKQLNRVRKVRNDVMHFDPDGIPPEDLKLLRDFVRFLQRLQGVGAT